MAETTKVRFLIFTSVEQAIAVLALLAISLSLFFRFEIVGGAHWQNYPLFVALIFGGIPLVWDLIKKALKKEFGSDLLAGISIVTAVLLDEYLAGTLVVLMLSGGQALENFAIEHASSVLKKLAQRVPDIAHFSVNGTLKDVAVSEICVGDTVVVFPHEVCPVDGQVIDGHSVMDESYLTGEPFMISKTPGTTVFSGTINGNGALTIRASKIALDSRFAKIVEVMKAAEQNRPPIRRLGDQLGAWYTPIAMLIAVIAALVTHDPIRFLAVIVVATPCPLLIAIPVAIIGAISLAAKRGIIIKNPALMEQLHRCRIIVFDKTGTLTQGTPSLVEETIAAGFSHSHVLQLVASIEQYSKHPLAQAIVNRAEERDLKPIEASAVHEPPGQGISGTVAGTKITITGRAQLTEKFGIDPAVIPAQQGGLECMILINGAFAARYIFRDTPRESGEAFIQHLFAKHRFQRVLLVSGDRESEVKYLADQVGITEIYASQSPEQKVAIVHEMRKIAPTAFIGDGINDAPALVTANAGVALGVGSDITSEAAGAVVMDSTLERIDELFHISNRMIRIALQSALGGMILSIGGMFIAAAGLMTPVRGAIAQEAIDVIVILNALRASLAPKSLRDFE